MNFSLTKIMFHTDDGFPQTCFTLRASLKHVSHLRSLSLNLPYQSQAREPYRADWESLSPLLLSSVGATPVYRIIELYVLSLSYKYNYHGRHLDYIYFFLHFPRWLPPLSNPQVLQQCLVLCRCTWKENTLKKDSFRWQYFQSVIDLISFSMHLSSCKSIWMQLSLSSS